MACTVATGCGAKSGTASVDYSVSAQKNYEKGLKELEDKDWLAASKYFQFIKSRFPYSKYAVLAELQDGGAGQGGQQRRVGGHDHLGAGLTEGGVSFRCRHEADDDRSGGRG